ncbi:hypothetical protein PSP6_470057 [Paraburkholderia tropica]|uniref:hypothetical protein n=1 Tax=Paraburkholderia tropica TaxID=92647 RepID=UPI001CB00D66|nr:hypothetical protein [Paraburkholderia tropica]CAG9224180.1 hypothetical protein PSP6_470057 [Paraburkholderia tropica]
MNGGMGALLRGAHAAPLCAKANGQFPPAKLNLTYRIFLARKWLLGKALGADKSGGNGVFFLS